MKLKSLLRKPFGWRTPAEEAFFALTLWGIGLLFWLRLKP